MIMGPKRRSSVQSAESFPLFDVKSSRGKSLVERKKLTRGELYGYAWFERYIPLIGCAIAIATYIACISITKFCGVFTSDLIFPFFSDTGLDGPGYAVFSVGLSIAACCMIATHYYIYRKVLSRKLYDRRDNLERHHKLRSLTCLIWTARVASLCGMCAAPFLAVLAVYDTARYTHTHLYWGAYPFFVLSAFKMFFYSIVYYHFAKVEQYDRTKYAWSRAMQTSGSLKFSIFFVSPSPSCSIYPLVDTSNTLGSSQSRSANTV